MVGRRHDGSEQSQPARFAIWSLVFAVNSSLFFLVMGRDYSDTPSETGTAQPDFTTLLYRTRVNTGVESIMTGHQRS